MSSAGKKIKNKVQQELDNQIKEANRSKRGWAVQRGVMNGKVIAFDEESPEARLPGSKREMLRQISGGSPVKSIKAELQTQVWDGGYKTTELYEVTRGGTTEYWFARRI